MDLIENDKMILDLELRIKEIKEQIRRTEGNGWPLILGIIGLMLTIFIIGFLIIIVAIFWAWDRSKKNSQYKSELQEYERRLFNLQTA